MTREEFEAASELYKRQIVAVAYLDPALAANTVITLAVAVCSALLLTIAKAERRSPSEVELDALMVRFREAIRATLPAMTSRAEVN